MQLRHLRQDTRDITAEKPQCRTQGGESAHCTTSSDVGISVEKLILTVFYFLFFNGSIFYLLHLCFDVQCSW